MARDVDQQAGSSLKRRSPDEVRVVRASNNDETSEASSVMTNHSTAIATAKIIPFRQKELLLIDSAGEPFVPMKPVVEGMGLAWQVQHRKLMAGRFASVITMMVTTGADGKRYEMACLPLRKLAGWLMSIHANKVRPELREGVIDYQNECDDVLWSYWNNGIAFRRDDRTAASVLSTTIGTDGFHCLAAVLDGKVRHLPAIARRGAKNHIWSQVHKAFSVVTAEDIPASQLDSVRNFIGSYALSGEWLPKQQSIQLEPGVTRRYMVSFDHKGEQQITPIPADACVMSTQQLIKAMVTPGELMVSNEEMFEFLQAGLVNLKMRSDWATEELRRHRRAAA